MPIQYQSQYIPLNIGAIAGQLAQKQKKWDEAEAMTNAAVSSLYGMETYDPQTRDQVVADLTGRIDEAVARRGGDLGAAKGDIARIISQERKNPFYQFNTQKVQAVKQFAQDQRRLGLNFYSTANPLQATMEDPSALNYQTYDLRDMDKLVGNVAKERATGFEQNIFRKDPNMPGFVEIGKQQGFENAAQASQWLNTEQGQQFIDETVGAMGLDPNDPNLRNRAAQVAMSNLVGRTDSRFVQDPSLKTAAGRSKQPGAAFALDRFSTTQTNDKLNQIKKDRADMLKEGSFDEQGRAIEGAIELPKAWGSITGATGITGTQKLKSNIDLITEAKTQFPSLVANFTNPDGSINDREFMSAVYDIQEERTGNQALSMAGIGGNKTLKKMFDEGKLFGTNEEIFRQVKDDYTGKIKESGISAKAIKEEGTLNNLFIDPIEGVIKMSHIGKGKKEPVQLQLGRNNDVLPKQVKDNLDLLGTFNRAIYGKEEYDVANQDKYSKLIFEADRGPVEITLLPSGDQPQFVQKPDGRWGANPNAFTIIKRWQDPTTGQLQATKVSPEQFTRERYQDIYGNIGVE